MALCRECSRIGPLLPGWRACGARPGARPELRPVLRNGLTAQEAVAQRAAGVSLDQARAFAALMGVAPLE